MIGWHSLLRGVSNKSSGGFDVFNVNLSNIQNTNRATIQLQLLQDHGIHEPTRKSRIERPNPLNSCHIAPMRRWIDSDWTRPTISTLCPTDTPSTRKDKGHMQRPWFWPCLAASRNGLYTRSSRSCYSESPTCGFTLALSPGLYRRGIDCWTISNSVRSLPPLSKYM